MIGQVFVRQKGNALCACHAVTRTPNKEGTSEVCYCGLYGS